MTGRRGGAPPQVPRLLAALLRRALPARHLDSVLGDLAEDAGRRPAWRRPLWLLLQTFTLLYWNHRALRSRRTLPASRTPMLSNLLFELRSALRSLRRSPGFAVAVVLTVAVGIASTTGVFAIVEGVLLTPLPFPEPERLVAVWTESSASKGLYEDLLARVESVEGLAAWSAGSRVLNDPDEGPRLLIGPEVTASFFTTLGVRARHGRLLTPDDSLPGAEPVVVLGHGLFERLGGDPLLLGSTLPLDETPWRVVGVLEPGADVLQADAAIVTPLSLDPAASGYRTGFYLNLVGRLRPETTAAEAAAELRSIASSLEGYSFSERLLAQPLVMPLHERLFGDRRPLLTLLLAAVAMVMAIGCVNVGSLTLARQLARKQELAVRTALGGGRGRGLVFLVSESLILVAAGWALGLLGAAWLLASLRAAAPVELPRSSEIGLNPSAIGLSVGLLAVAMLAAGVLPGWRATRLDPAQALRPGRGASAGRRAGRIGESLVVAETALAVVLAAAAGLLAHSMWELVSLDPGFETERRLLLQVVPPAQGNDRPFDVDDYYEAILSGLEALPSVERAGTVHTAPVRGGGWVMSTEVEGVEYGERSEQPLSYWRVISPSYFEALGARLRDGRSFGEVDVAGSTPVAIVNATLAAERWPGEDPLGRRLRIGFDSADWLTVVGVVEDIRMLGPATSTPPTVYRPLAQGATALERVGVTTQSLVLLTRDEPMAAVQAVREAMRELAPGAPLLAPAPLRSVVRDSIAEPRVLLQVVGLFGSAALLLAVLGIGGVVGNLVRQRRRELGIRQALGALPAQLSRHCLVHGCRLGAIGIGLGMGAAILLAPRLGAFLHATSPRDPLSLGLVALVLALCVLLASWIPARRATRIAPSEALRGD